MWRGKARRGPGFSRSGAFQAPRERESCRTAAVGSRRCLRLALAILGAASVFAADETLIAPDHRLTANDPAWRDVTEKFARQPDTFAEFVERRFFAFRRDPVVLKGEARLSRDRGLSLHYTGGEDRVIIIDAQGMLIRDANGQGAPPDPRANSANAALRRILGLDFPALEKDFDLYGRRGGVTWSLALVPHDETMRRMIGDIFVVGDATAVQSIELWRGAKQHIDIVMSATRSPANFSAEELRKYFR